MKRIKTGKTIFSTRKCWKYKTFKILQLSNFSSNENIICSLLLDTSFLNKSYGTQGQYKKFCFLFLNKYSLRNILN